MIRTLKGKITLIYLCLVLIIAIVGGISLFNLYTLGNSVNGLMTDNYKSINACNNMLQVLEHQNDVIVSYIDYPNKDNVNEFYKSSNEFYKWFNVQLNNITEKGEMKNVDKVKNQYVNYLKAFSELQIIKSNSNTEASLKYYNSSIMPIFSGLREELRSISSINDNAMLRSKDIITNDTNESSNFVLSLSILLVGASFFLSRIYVNKFLKPIYLLTETVKLVKAGDLNQEAPIIFEDEIGNLAKEFNHMTKRLQQFEQSTLGNLLNEKNKSLSIVKSISDPLIVLDTNYKIILLNDKCEEFFNIKEENVIGRHFLEAIRSGELYDYILDVYHGEKKEGQKILSFVKNNDEYYFNVIITEIADNYSKHNGLVIFLQDVTALKQVEQIKSEFVSSVSHEFKTPLTSIMIGMDLMANKDIGQLSEKQIEIMNTIKEDVEKLSNLVNNLLKISKIEYDKSIFDMEPCSMSEVIERSVKSFEASAQSKNIKLHSKLDNNLEKVMGDNEKLTWVVSNLISNAIKFTNDGGSIFVECYQKNNKIYTSVEDTGIGIDERYLDKVFEKFIQVNNQEIDNDGTGLGLAIVKQIVEVHGGEVWCKSELGVGSKFIFTIPVIH